MGKRELAALTSDLGGYWGTGANDAGNKQPNAATKAVAPKSQSTQFFAGNRVELDDSFLESCKTVPHLSGTPGTAEFRVSFVPKEDGDVSLEDLEAARSSWDEHLSKIDSASKRLHACIEVFEQEEELPLFFAGKGTLAEVLSLHVSMDPMAMNGPTWGRPLGYRREERAFLPQGVLGEYVDQFLYSAFCGFEEENVRYAKTEHLQRFISKLIRAGGSDIVAPFFEPLGSSFMGSLSFFRGGGSTFALMVREGLQHKPGNNAVQSMMDFSQYLEEEDFGCMEELEWLIGKLEAKKAN